MIILDRLLVGGIKFVLTKVAQAVESEMDDASVLREQLLDAQMRAEVGELSEEEFAEIEKDILARMRRIQEEKTGEAAGPIELKGKKATVEASFEADEEH